MNFVCINARFLFNNGIKRYTVEYMYGLSMWYVFDEEERRSSLFHKNMNDEMKPEFIVAANAYAERVCNGEFPITYTREQVVAHTASDYIAGASAFKNQVLAVLKENYEACKNLVQEDKIRSAQEMVNETYEDLIAIFS